MSHPTLLLCIPILPPLCFPSYHNHTHFPLSGVQHLSASIMLSPMSVHFYLLLIQSKFRPPHPASLKFEPVPFCHRQNGCARIDQSLHDQMLSQAQCRPVGKRAAYSSLRRWIESDVVLKQAGFLSLHSHFQGILHTGLTLRSLLEMDADMSHMLYNISLCSPMLIQFIRKQCRHDHLPLIRIFH